jgi:alkylation response protein AidB-like acyl-CoA dehydrogenase
VIFSDEQRAFAQALRDFCARECGTREQRDALTEGGVESHSPEIYGRLANLGWLGVSTPEEYGGAGGDLLDQVIFFEEMYRGLAPIYAASSSFTVAGIYLRYGNEEQKRDVLDAFCRGSVMSIGISEPEAGSDVGAVSTSARWDHDRYVINGQKTWCSSAHMADRVLLLARTSREQSRHAGLTLLEVPMGAAGIEVRPIATMGGRDVNDVFFTNVEVDASAVVGEVGQGWRQIMAGLNGERMMCCAQCLGMAERTLDDLLAYVKERKQFGRPIGTFQALRHRIADLAVEIESAKALTYDVAERVRSGRGDKDELVRLTSMAKIKTTETAKRVALEGMQMMGGYGYACEYDMERHVRKSLITTVYAGTNEIQREVISASLGLR